MSKKVYLTITGGGTGAIGNILREGGMSEYFVGAFVPYSTFQVNGMLRGKPEKYCSAQVARQLAISSYMQAREGNEKSEEIMGVGVTASLHKAGEERPDRENVAYVAFQINNKVFTYTIDLKASTQLDSPNKREDQEHYLATLIAAKVKLWLSHGILTDLPNLPEALDVCESLMKVYHTEFQRVNYATKMSDGDKYCLFPGSFNPPHNGHIEMARQAHKLTGLPVVFELSVLNWEKPIVDPVDLSKRIDNLVPFENEPWFGGIVITTNSMMTNKIYSLKPEYVIVGMDTAIRLLNSLNKWKTRELIEVCSPQDTRFLVFDRKDWLKSYLEHRETINTAINEDEESPFTTAQFGHLFVNVAEENYKDDGVSSTLVRLMSNA